MTERAIEHTAAWLDGAALSEAAPADTAWACVEIFGHRKHYGRISEVEKFGAKMLRVDVPAAAPAPLLGEGEKFETFVYGGGAIFSITPMTEEACRKWHAERNRPYEPMVRLPRPTVDYIGDDEEHPF